MLKGRTEAAIAMDPGAVFFPEKLTATGVTSPTNRECLNNLVKKGLLWRVNEQGRTGYRNCFEHRVGAHIRKIIPLSPEGDMQRA